MVLGKQHKDKRILGVVSEGRGSTTSVHKCTSLAKLLPFLTLSEAGLRWGVLAHLYQHRIMHK